MTTVELFNLIASIFGIVTGIVALALSIIFFFSAKKAERNTENAVIELSESTKTISGLSLRMLNKMTGALVSPKDKHEERLYEILKSLTGRGKLEDDQEGDVSSTKKNAGMLEQFRVDNLIAAYYYCTLTNLAYKTMLPQTIEEVPLYQPIANMVNQTRNDLKIMEAWLAGTDESEQKIQNSPVRHMYEEAKGLAASAESVEEYYINKPTRIS